MQQLQFEASWNKTLSTKDRELIQTIFDETKNVNHFGIQFTPIREAINHKQELLVTVIVHNFSQNPFLFNNTRIAFCNNHEVIVEKVFTLPTITIPPFVSMPWTFIFPAFDGELEKITSTGTLKFIENEFTT